MREILKTIKVTFMNGNGVTRLGFGIMGIRQILGHQLVKGLTFMAAEIIFIGLLISKGISAIGSLFTLGTHRQGWQYDAQLGFKVRVAGDNSMLLLLYGIFALILVIVFIVIWYQNVLSMRELDKLKAASASVPTFFQEMRSFLDQRFHITLLAIPTLSIVLFTVLPLIYMISIAFTSYDHKHLPPRNLFGWVGLANFGNVFSGEIAHTFFPLLAWTLIWATIATASCFFFGVILAMMLNAHGVIGKKFLRILFVITMAVPPFVSLLVMSNLLHSSGPINAALMNMGIIHTPIPFLTNGLMAKVSVIFVNMWIGIPASMLITTGVIINLPQEQIEAARIDGANPYQIFRHITFPQILTVMAPALIQQFVGNINNFNVIYLLTGGLPSNSGYYGAGETDLLVTWLYKLTVDNTDYNLASVIGIVTFVLSAVLSLLVYTRTNSYQSGEVA